MISEMRLIAERLSMKYKVPEEDIFRLLKSGINMGLSLKACEVGLRMSLGATAGGNRELFTIEEIIEITGESREEVVKHIEQIRQEAAEKGENPDDYAIHINPDLLN